MKCRRAEFFNRLMFQFFFWAYIFLMIGLKR